MEAHEDGDSMIMEDFKCLIKGKRSKRRRPSSTLTLTLASTATSSSSSTTTTTTSTSAAPANHSGFFQMPSTTSIEFTNIHQENHPNNDQDIANCLMLLAHGHHLPPPRQPFNKVVPTQSYVYECKTCDRGFTSFQALGGHRASHNKPHKDVHELSKDKRSIFIGPSKPLSCNPSDSTKWPKVHECSICGSGFTSGQALGGHMRRHRSMTMTTTTTTTTTATICHTSNQCHEPKKLKAILPLDLNLPAPIEDDHKETNNSFRSNKQIIAFSTPSLVDCHF